MRISDDQRCHLLVAEGYISAMVPPEKIDRQLNAIPRSKIARRAQSVLPSG